MKSTTNTIFHNIWIEHLNCWHILSSLEKVKNIATRSLYPCIVEEEVKSVVRQRSIHKKGAINKISCNIIYLSVCILIISSCNFLCISVFHWNASRSFSFLALELFQKHTGKKNRNLCCFLQFVHLKRTKCVDGLFIKRF